MLNFVRFPKTQQRGISAFGALVVHILDFGKYKEMNYLAFLPSTKTPVECALWGLFVKNVPILFLFCENRPAYLYAWPIVETFGNATTFPNYCKPTKII